jgi:pimeloyl-ACP methyl ester carboxylesterase
MDEFGLLVDNAAEAGLDWKGSPAVERVSHALDDGRRISALRWGGAAPEIVLFHGGAQNAHTWDTVALALDRPLLAVDLPGHGHSDWRDDHDYRPEVIAADVTPVVAELAPDAAMVVGMSLGGLTALALAATAPELVRRLVVVDVTPGTDREKAAPIVAFVSGPERFASFDEILERTIAHNPTRTESSLRRGVLHNAIEHEDGSWTWRYDRLRSVIEPTGDFAGLWDAVSAVRVPMMLVRGGWSGVVGDEDVAELRRRQPGARVELVADAGHSIQGDQPVALARLLEDFVDGG